jgi:hypothetical protein
MYFWRKIFWINFLLWIQNEMIISL